jgi:hypothetical protein
MRPTLLGFRSVKEKTPPSYDLRLTYDGRISNFALDKPIEKRGSFSHERRFVAYDINSKRTGFRVGPGSYYPEKRVDKIRGGSPYRELHSKQRTENNGYYMVGNCLEFEPSWMLSSKKALQRERSLNKDCTHLNSRAMRSATTTNSLNFEKDVKPEEAEKIIPFTPRVERFKSKKVKRVNKSMKIDTLIRRRFN